MSQDARTSRLTRPSSAAERSQGMGLASPTLVSLLAHTTRLVDLLPTLHQHALDVTGGSRLLLFEHNLRNGVLQATSSFGLDEFAQSLSANLQLAAGLDSFCHGAKRLFGADRTSVWIHDRRARSLVLRASTDSLQGASEVQIPADDPQSPAAVAMRRARAEIL